MSILKKIIPPEKWKLPVIIVLGIFVGLALFIFKISNAPSYLSDEPKTCINCHVMYPEYATWFHSSHRENATCNDCHVPHNNVFAKYFFKAKDGLRHSAIFTLRLEPQTIFIKEAGISVVQENCKRCHQNVVENVSIFNITAQGAMDGEGKLCWDCHKEIPHGTVKSLSSTPNAIVPKLDSPVPEWLQKLMDSK
jgi:cytochrome c nitrite reductase small subunit